MTLPPRFATRRSPLQCRLYGAVVPGETGLDARGGSPSPQLVKIVKAESGISVIDELVGRTCVVLERGIDSDIEPWLEVLVEKQRLLVYEQDLELISIS